MSDYETGPVCLDDLVTVMGVYDPRNRWNGFLNPALDAWSVEKVLTAIATAKAADEDDCTVTWDWTDDLALRLVETDGHESSVEYLTPDSEGCYALGNYGWVWTADPEFAPCGICYVVSRAAAWAHDSEVGEYAVCPVHDVDSNAPARPHADHLTWPPTSEDQQYVEVAS